MNSITVCTDGRSRHSWECWQRYESKILTWDNSTFREFSPLRTCSSFNRFLYRGSRVLGVVQSTKCFALKWETSRRLSTCVVRSCLYLDTDFVDIPFRVPQCYLFRRRTIFAYFENITKISKGFKKWNCRNCFRKTKLVFTQAFLPKKSQWLELQHQLQIWFLVSKNSMYLKERLLISLNPPEFFLARSNSKRHCIFVWIVMFNLTNFWVRENSIFLFEYRNLVNIKRWIICWVFYNQLFDWRFLFVRYCPGAFYK